MTRFRQQTASSDCTSDSASETVTDWQHYHTRGVAAVAAQTHPQRKTRCSGCLIAPGGYSFAHTHRASPQDPRRSAKQACSTHAFRARSRERRQIKFTTHILAARRTEPPVCLCRALQDRRGTRRQRRTRPMGDSVLDQVSMYGGWGVQKSGTDHGSR